MPCELCGKYLVAQAMSVSTTVKWVLLWFRESKFSPLSAWMMMMMMMMVDDDDDDDDDDYNYVFPR